MAVAAGYPGLEQTEWTRMILAHLYENTGHLDSAKYQYEVALQERPDYAFAIAGLGRTEKAKGNYKDAIVYFEKAQKNQMYKFFIISDYLAPGEDDRVSIALPQTPP